MAFSHLRYEVRDRIALITLNRPEKLNAFSIPTVHEVLEAIELADGDDEVRVILFTGEGKAYSVGSDLSEAGGDTFDYDKYGKLDGTPRDLGGYITLRLFECKKPVMVAFNGTAAGVGLTMTLAADFRLASTAAKFCFPFVKRGIVPESNASWFLPRLVGLPKALDWMLSARVFSVEEAHAAGLVGSVHAPEDLLPAAFAQAAQIANETAPVSVAIARQLLWRMADAPHPMMAHSVESSGVYHTGRLPDAVEGITSFLQKRPAEYKAKLSEDLPTWWPWWETPEYEPPV